MKLGEALGGSFKTYAKKPILFSGIYALVSLAVLIFNIILMYTGASALLVTAMFNGDWMTLLSFGGFLVILSIIVSVVAGVLSLGGLIKAVSDTVAGHKTSIMECIKYAFSKIKDYIILALHVFWYSLAWVMIILMLLTPMLIGVFGGSNAVGENPTAYAQDFDFDSADMAEFETMMEEYADGDFAGFESYGSFGGPMVNIPPVLGLVYLVLMIFVIYRVLRSIFSFYALFDDKSLTPKKALERSLAATKGKIWRLIGYLLVFGIAIGILAGLVGSIIINPLVNALSNNYDSMMFWSTIFNFVLTAIIAPITIIYYFLIYKGFSKEHN